MVHWRWNVNIYIARNPHPRAHWKLNVSVYSENPPPPQWITESEMSVYIARNPHPVTHSRWNVSLYSEKPPPSGSLNVKCQCIYRKKHPTQWLNEGEMPVYIPKKTPHPVAHWMWNVSVYTEKNTPPSDSLNVKCQCIYRKKHPTQWLTEGEMSVYIARNSHPVNQWRWNVSA